MMRRSAGESIVGESIVGDTLGERPYGNGPEAWDGMWG